MRRCKLGRYDRFRRRYERITRLGHGLSRRHTRHWRSRNVFR